MRQTTRRRSELSQGIVPVSHLCKPPPEARCHLAVDEQSHRDAELGHRLDAVGHEAGPRVPARPALAVHEHGGAASECVHRGEPLLRKRHPGVQSLRLPQPDHLAHCLAQNGHGHGLHLRRLAELPPRPRQVLLHDGQRRVPQLATLEKELLPLLPRVRQALLEHAEHRALLHASLPAAHSGFVSPTPQSVLKLLHHPPLDHHAHINPWGLAEGLGLPEIRPQLKGHSDVPWLEGALSHEERELRPHACIRPPTPKGQRQRGAA